MTKQTRLGAIDTGQYCIIAEITESTILPEVKEAIVGKKVKVETICWAISRIHFSEEDQKIFARSKHRSIREIANSMTLSTETIVDYEL